MSPLLPQRLEEGTSYNGLKGEAHSEGLVMACAFTSCVRQKGKKDCQLVGMDSW